MFRLMLLICLLQPVVSGCKTYYLAVGSYTTSGSKGIYIYRFDDETGSLEWVSNTPENSVINPSYLTFSPDHKYIYACTNTRAATEGSVSAFSFSKNGALAFINKQPSGGANPVYLSAHYSGKWLVNANYTAGNVSVFPINDDGTIAPARQVIQHSGSGPDTGRQAQAHVHATVFAPRQDYLFVPDLGADKIFTYTFHAAEYEPLDSATIPSTAVTSGSGPRHFTFHPNGAFAYCLEELSGCVTAYRYSDGSLTPIQHIMSYKKKEKEYNSADIHISPDGRFLYATNRNRENNISIFSIDDVTGNLSLVGHENTGGKEPRNFTITPTGNFLLVANQVSGNVIVFRRDHKTGLLEKTKNKINLSEPSCLQMVEVR